MKVMHTVEKKMEKTLNVTLEEDETSEDESIMYKSQDLKVLLESLKEKFQESVYQTKLQILTLSPHSWSVQKTCEYFDCSTYMVEKARSIKEQRGVLGLSDPKKGRFLNRDVVDKVREFYEDDDISRICPGAKETVSVKIDGEKVKKQKRLVLLGLKESYERWKEVNPSDTIGFSSFASLRPKWCVLPGSSGTHAVCVCKQHQNVKLMTAACKCKTPYNDLIKMTVCSTDSEDCMMGICDHCPGSETLRNHLEQIGDLKLFDVMEFKQWESTDRTTLITLVEETDDFIDLLCEKILELKKHHFTAKQQSQHLKKLKDNIQEEEECIILGDFAENYSFVVQDAIQGYHWEKDQATIHPFVVYYRMGGTLTHQSYACISNISQHTTEVVYYFQQELLKKVSVLLPKLKKVFYFSDGAASQYKILAQFVSSSSRFSCRG